MSNSPPLARPNKLLFQVKELGKTYTIGGGFRAKSMRALRDVSFELHEGECVALVGESGSGKSTILKILSRLTAPTEGQIIFRGKNLLRDEARGASLAYRGHVQMIFQDPFASLNPVHSIRHHLSRPLLRHKKARPGDDLEQKVLALLKKVGLMPELEFANKYPHEMSGGQRQRVVIARALAVDPQVILADEPISMLDVSLRMGILNLMNDLKSATQMAYLYVTHDLASARYVADQILVMYSGEIVESGPSHTVLENPSHPYTRLLINSAPSQTEEASEKSSRKDSSSQTSSPLSREGTASGCQFAPRCPQVHSKCHQQKPAFIRLPLQEGTPHHVKCHLYDV